MALKGRTTETPPVNLTARNPRCTCTPLTRTAKLALLAGNCTTTINPYDKKPWTAECSAGLFADSAAVDLVNDYLLSAPVVGGNGRAAQASLGRIGGGGGGGTGGPGGGNQDQSGGCGGGITEARASRPPQAMPAVPTAHSGRVWGAPTVVAAVAEASIRKLPRGMAREAQAASAAAQGPMCITALREVEKGGAGGRVAVALHTDRADRWLATIAGGDGHSANHGGGRL